MRDESTRRQLRDFDFEAEQRQRRLFVLLMAGFAILAIVAGIIVAIWIIPPPEQPEVPPMPYPEPEPVEKIEAPTPLWDEVEPEEPQRAGRPSLKNALDDRDIGRGLARLRSALDACARKHGAIDGTYVTVDFSVQGSGRVDEAYARPPHTDNPLGLCVSQVFRTRGRFKRTKNGLQDIRRTVKLRRPDLHEG